MKSWVAHYQNKYPGSDVTSDDNSLSVFKGGKQLLALKKDGAGSWHDVSEEFGLPERHDLSPIPRDARVAKVIGGKIGIDAEEGESRKKKAKEFADENGKILSCAELNKKGFAFDEKHRCVVRPVPKESAPAQLPRGDMGGGDHQA